VVGLCSTAPRRAEVNGELGHHDLGMGMDIDMIVQFSITRHRRHTLLSSALLMLAELQITSVSKTLMASISTSQEHSLHHQTRLLCLDRSLSRRR